MRNLHKGTKMKKSEFRTLLREEIRDIMSESKVTDVIDRLSKKMKEFDTPFGENNYNDGIRRGLALAIANLQAIK